MGIVPGTGRVYWDGVTGAYGCIGWDDPDHAPFLLIGGELDLIADASMTRAIHCKQALAPSRTALKIFEDRSRWTCMDAGWETVADYALDWARSKRVGPGPDEEATDPMLDQPHGPVIFVHGLWVRQPPHAHSASRRDVGRPARPQSPAADHSRRPGPAGDALSFAGSLGHPASVERPEGLLAFHRRSRLLVAEPGWQHVADACLAWDATNRVRRAP